MITLGIETSCDETAASVVCRGQILSNVVSSSVPFHEKYGGVIPEIASRFHIEYINRVTKQALKKARKSLEDVELIAFTESPGLPGCLIAGSSFARVLSYACGIQLIGVNHLHAHIYANFLNRTMVLSHDFPFVGAVVSGGHTNIFLCKSLLDFELIGRTRDDAIGEAFDKVARMLGIGYPGGPKIERFAKKYAMSFGKREPIDFPRVLLEEDSFDFSLSGIKTAVFYHTRGKKQSQREISRIAWSFQEAVFDVLVQRSVTACKKFDIKNILMGGGVISNMRLQAKLKNACKKMGYAVQYPPKGLCVDNAAMVAGLGEIIRQKGGMK